MYKAMGVLVAIQWPFSHKLHLICVARQLEHGVRTRMKRPRPQ